MKSSRATFSRSGRACSGSPCLKAQEPNAAPAGLEPAAATTAEIERSPAAPAALDLLASVSCLRKELPVDAKEEVTSPARASSVATAVKRPCSQRLKQEMSQALEEKQALEQRCRELEVQLERALQHNAHLGAQLTESVKMNHGLMWELSALRETNVSLRHQLQRAHEDMALEFEESKSDVLVESVLMQL
eukprot:tig00021435_g21397.t1